jgi:hypothetical protein
VTSWSLLAGMALKTKYLSLPDMCEMTMTGQSLAVPDMGGEFDG